MEQMFGNAPFAILSARIDGDRPWYAGGEGAAIALGRVANGAPKRWTRPDRPDGPFDPLSPDAELARVAAFKADLDDDFERLVGDPDKPAWRRPAHASLARGSARQRQAARMATGD